MPISIERDELQRLLARGAQLVEVLPEQQYRDEGHLPGAINIPLKRLAADAPSRLRRDLPVVVYCHDTV
jgi:rhodanese-related sulfurtransferase